MRPYRLAAVSAYTAPDGYTDKRGIPAALAVVASEESGTPALIVRHGLARGSIAAPDATVTVRASTPRQTPPEAVRVIDAQGRSILLCPATPELRSWSHQRVRGNGGVRTAVQSSAPEPTYTVRVQRTERDTARKPSRRAMLMASRDDIATSLSAAMAARDTARAGALSRALHATEQELSELPTLPTRAVSVTPSAEQATADAEAARHARAQSELDRKAALIAAVNAPTPARDWRGADK